MEKLKMNKQLSTSFAGDGFAGVQQKSSKISHKSLGKSTVEINN